MTNRAVKVLLILNLIVSTGILVRPSVMSLSVAAQSTATPFNRQREIIGVFVPAGLVLVLAVLSVRKSICKPPRKLGH